MTGHTAFFMQRSFNREHEKRLKKKGYLKRTSYLKLNQNEKNIKYKKLLSAGCSYSTKLQDACQKNLMKG